MVKTRSLVWILLAVASVSLLACSGVFAARPPKPPVVSLVSAGVGTSTITGNVFTPREISVPVGSTVSWEITSDEVHTITFIPEKASTPAGPPHAWPATLQSGAVAQFDDAAVINSGIIFKGDRISVTFSRPGLSPTSAPCTPACKAW